MPLIIPSPEYAKRRKILQINNKIKKLEKDRTGKITLVLKKEIDLNNLNESLKFISMLKELEGRNFFDELYIVKSDRVFDYLDIERGLDQKSIEKEKLIKLYNIISRFSNIIDKIKKIY
ncbi:hypothetical protein [Candidatus Nanobsidianus stetteri]|uniref:Uncharacterized protein n=1 Tax=Nanobsidianus stetteri TaxID=1294122 RepID=A0A2T9WM61_NANST|nr:hypothetical protein [Candidatus Nanobsidianus stetteri]MCC5446903.1 hypothetical protein [Candidatus Nanobsidianus stetteri]